MNREKMAEIARAAPVRVREFVDESIPVKRHGHRQIYLLCIAICAAMMIFYAVYLGNKWADAVANPSQKASFEVVTSLELPVFVVCPDTEEISLSVAWTHPGAYGGDAVFNVMDIQMDGYPEVCYFFPGEKTSSKPSDLYRWQFFATFASNDSVRSLPFGYISQAKYAELLETPFLSFEDTLAFQDTTFEIPFNLYTSGEFSKEVQKRSGRTEILWDTVLASLRFSPSDEAFIYDYNAEQGLLGEPPAEFAVFVLKARSFKVETISEVAVFGFEEFFAALSSALAAASLFIEFFFPGDFKETRHFLLGDKVANKLVKQKKSDASSNSQQKEQKGEANAEPTKENPGKDEPVDELAASADTHVEIDQLGSSQEQTGSASQSDQSNV
jgi:hypothetical protein